jgi:hypothetical protein
MGKRTGEMVSMDNKNFSDRFEKKRKEAISRSEILI